MYYVNSLSGALKDRLDEFYDLLDHVWFLEASPERLQGLREASHILALMPGHFDVLFDAIEV
jgi:hypothetical protein